MATRYEHYILGNDSEGSIYGTEWKAQTFTPDTDHTIGSVVLLLLKTGSPTTITVYIYGTTTGKPSGASLCSGTTDGNTLPTGSPYEWRTITLGSGTALTAAIQYAIVVKSAAGASSNRTDWRVDQSSPTYSGGVSLYSHNSGTDWTIVSSVDFLFEEWEGVPTLPGYDEYPTNDLLRASGIRRTFWAGIGGLSVYQVELALGGMSTAYASPVGSRKISSAVVEMETLLEDVKEKGFDYKGGIPQEYFTGEYGEAWAQAAGTPGRIEAMRKYRQTKFPDEPLPSELAPGMENVYDINIQLGGSYVGGILTPPASWQGSATAWSRHVRDVAANR